MNTRCSHWLAVLLSLSCALLLGGAPQVQAAARAWVSPDRIEMGQTTTLRVETDHSVNQVPDLSALAATFNVLGQSSSTNTTITGGAVVTSTTFHFELEPREAGVLGIPALQVAGESTTPLQLTVLPARVGSAAAGDVIYLETELDSESPYVQQALRYTVRLYYAVPLINGNVEAPAPEHAALQPLGEERNYTREVAGRNYQVFERNYLLLPERSGTLTLPAPLFRGRARNSNVDPFFDRGQNVNATGQARTLEVRAQPAGAPAPWLAARGARFSRAEVAQQGKVGEPLMLELTLEVDGVAASQLPPLNLPDIPGAQVFPEAPQQQDQLAQGQIRAQLRRRFAIVPTAAGVLSIPELRVGYWNTSSDHADAATVPALELQISGTAVATPGGASTVPDIQPGALGAGMRPAADTAALWPWQWAVAVLSVSLLAALYWGWSRGRPRARTGALPAAPTAAQQQLSDALANGDLRRLSLLLAQASAAHSVEQRQLLDQLQQMLWSAEPAGDQQLLLVKLRSAFAPLRRGDANRSKPAVDLPELYPSRN